MEWSEEYELMDRKIRSLLLNKCINSCAWILNLNIEVQSQVVEADSG